jgi:HAD superfamily hydrolase (TIGR01490 family)
VNRQRPFAVFDIDGTLIRWQLYHAVADELAAQGHFDPAAYQKVREARMTWKKRLSKASFRDYEHRLVELVDATISGIKVADLRRANLAVMAEYQDQVYTYTRDLLRELKAANYLLFAISASESGIVSLLADYYGFDDYGGTDYGTKAGYLTGEKHLLLSERKPAYLRTLVAKHHAVWQGSVAVGDSEGDIPMLSAVEQPIAFNPTRELFTYARQQQWRIVIERKNVSYELEAHHGSYELKNS